MINANLFCKDLVNLFKNFDKYDEEDTAAKMFCKAFKDHIEQNAMVTFAWSGVSPAGVPDPVVVATGKIQFLPVVTTKAYNKAISISDESSFDKAISGVLKDAIIIMDDPTMVAVPTLNPQGSVVTTISTKSSTTKDMDPKDVSVMFYEELFASIKTAMLNPNPIPGQHAAFTGNLTMTTII